jgi:hypothetical protein
LFARRENSYKQVNILSFWESELVCRRENPSLLPPVKAAYGAQDDIILSAIIVYGNCMSWFANNGPTILGYATIPYTIGSLMIYRKGFRMSYYVATPLAVFTTLASYTALAAAVMLIPPSKDTEIQ